MVNRVDNSNIYTNSYTPGTGQRKRVDAASVPAFLLDHDERGVVWDRGQDEKPGENELALNNKLSREKKETYESSIAKQEDKDREDASDTDALLENISQFVKNLFKKILDFVWYGSDDKDSENSNETADSVLSGDEKSKTAAFTDAEKAAAEVKETVSTKPASKKEKKNAAYEIPEPEGTPAHNTSIITYYDRRGRIVKLDEMDARRILFNETLEHEIDAGEYGRYRKYM